MDGYEYDPLMFPVIDDEHEDAADRKDNNTFEIDPDEGFDKEENFYVYDD